MRLEVLCVFGVWTLALGVSVRSLGFRVFWCLGFGACCFGSESYSRMVEKVRAVLHYTPKRVVFSLPACTHIDTHQSHQIPGPEHAP